MLESWDKENRFLAYNILKNGSLQLSLEQYENIRSILVYNMQNAKSASTSEYMEMADLVRLIRKNYLS